MAKMFKDQDGTIQEVTGSRVITRDWIEEEIRQAEAHLANMKEMLDDYQQLSGEATGDNTAPTPAPATQLSQPEVVVADVVVVGPPQQVVAAPATPVATDPQTPTPAPVPAAPVVAPQIIPVQQ